jgi:hypothetical protein
MKTPKPDAPCDSKRPNCGPFRKVQMGIPYAFPAFTGDQGKGLVPGVPGSDIYGAAHN